MQAEQDISQLQDSLEVAWRNHDAAKGIARLFRKLGLIKAAYNFETALGQLKLEELMGDTDINLDQN